MPRREHLELEEREESGGGRAGRKGEGVSEGKRQKDTTGRVRDTVSGSKHTES